MNTVFVKNKCAACDRLKLLVLQHGLSSKVQFKNIDTDAYARVQFDRTGSYSVPTAIVAGFTFVDVGPILEALRANR